VRACVRVRVRACVQGDVITSTTSWETKSLL